MPDRDGIPIEGEWLEGFYDEMRERIFAAVDDLIPAPTSYGNGCACNPGAVSDAVMLVILGDVKNVGTTHEGAQPSSEQDALDGVAPYEPVVPTHCPCCGSDTRVTPEQVDALARQERDWNSPPAIAARGRLDARRRDEEATREHYAATQEASDAE